MGNPLRPCSACARHVRASDSSCPFCGEALERVAPRGAIGSNKGLMRAAILFATAATAASCGGKEQQVPGQTSTSSGGSSSGTSASGGTSGSSGGTSGTSGGTSGTSGGTSGTSGDTSNGAVPPYGIPPIDGGEEERDGGAVPLYGPPPIDP